MDYRYDQKRDEQKNIKTEYKDEGKYLNYRMKTADLPLPSLNTMYYEHFYKKEYRWWYDVQPGDVVVDIGASIGFFTCHALDRGASKIYSIEPNRYHLKTLMQNISDYYIDHESCPVVPIHAAIGFDNNIYGLDVEANHMQNYKKYTFKQWREEYNIEWIDYLKVDCEGGEYDVFSEENLDFIKNRVKHISVEFHIDAFPECPDHFIRFRDEYTRILGLEKFQFNDEEDRKKTNDTAWLKSQWPLGWGSNWMMYYLNHDIAKPQQTTNDWVAQSNEVTKQMQENDKKDHIFRPELLTFGS